MNAAFTHKPAPDRPPPRISVGAVGWMRDNLFSSWMNTALTIVAVYILITLIPPFVQWALLDANWGGRDRSICDANKDGACWTFIKVRFLQIMFGLYYGANPDQVWRPVLAFALLIALAIPLFVESFPYKRYVSIGLLVVFPFVGYGLIHGQWFGLPVAETSQWGGFMLTFVLASVGIVCALPIGILLALGRRSNMPLVRTLSVSYIEFWRGTPLITILFMASVMLPLFFPAEVDFDKVARAMIGIALFQSAYTAEAIRGGLQAMPRGQFEGADAMGLKYWQSMRLIILPQALKISIPGIVNSFIELFKDTSLVAIIGLLDLLNMAQTASRSIEWKGYDIEAYLFAALLFWICCYGMSRYSQALERKLDTGHKH
ncbi:MAG: Inner membrane amino-acid ABC transporter permease protein YhdY [Gammaproteobacteria bacterium]|nr:Inner membrane amino-acid ABC transporter permease protein YhdY [Gammaproteobacteria bacterium]